MTRKNFICKVVNELIDDKFSVLINYNKELSLGGSFDYSNREFIVSMATKGGFEVFIHEYSHFLQWKNEKKYFMSLINNCYIVFDWLDGTFYKKAIVTEAIKGVIELEWDCERKSIDLIKKYKLDVNIEEYCKSANSYLLFYNIVRQERNWYGKEGGNKKLLDTMPVTILDLDYYLDENNISDKQKKQYIRLLSK
jgi:hypothetical protein